MARQQRPMTVGLVALALLGLTTPAFGQNAAVLGIGGDGSARLKSEMGEILLNAVEANEALTADDQRDLNVTEALMFLGCSEVTTMCLRELAFTLEVDRVLYGAVRETPGETEIDIHYFDAIANETVLDQTFPLNNTGDRSAFEMRLAATVSNHVVLQVAAERAGVSIFLDGENLGTAPVVALDVAPGRHTLVAACTDCPAFERVLDLRPGVVYEEVVRFQGAVAVGAGDDDGDGETRGGGRNLLVPTLTIAAGGAMLVTGAVFGFVMNSTQDDFDVTPSLNEAEGLADDGETQALLANIFLATGAAVTVTGIILLFVLDDEEPESRPVSEVRAAPYVGPNGGGFVIGGVF